MTRRLTDEAGRTKAKEVEVRSTCTNVRRQRSSTLRHAASVVHAAAQHARSSLSGWRILLPPILRRRRTAISPACSTSEQYRFLDVARPLAQALCSDGAIQRDHAAYLSQQRHSLVSRGLLQQQNSIAPTFRPNPPPLESYARESWHAYESPQEVTPIKERYSDGEEKTWRTSDYEQQRSPRKSRKLCWLLCGIIGCSLWLILAIILTCIYFSLRLPVVVFKGIEAPKDVPPAAISLQGVQVNLEAKVCCLSWLRTIR